jgi:oral-facial-digital syndrome 1 protein
MEMQGEQMTAGSAGSLLLGEEGEDEGERTSEKLKAQLYLSLQSKGILSQLKSQLRCRLVQELRRGSGSATPPVPLALQVANGVVAEHLRGCGYQYTLSTFLPESSTHLDRVSPTIDVYLPNHPDTRGY